MSHNNSYIYFGGGSLSINTFRRSEVERIKQTRYVPLMKQGPCHSCHSLSQQEVCRLGAAGLVPSGREGPPVRSGPQIWHDFGSHVVQTLSSQNG